MAASRLVPGAVGVPEVPGMGVPRIPGPPAACPDGRQSPSGHTAAPGRWASAAFQVVVVVTGGEGTAVTHPPPTHGCSSYLGRVSQPAVPAMGALGTLSLC